MLDLPLSSAFPLVEQRCMFLSLYVVCSHGRFRIRLLKHFKFWWREQNTCIWKTRCWRFTSSIAVLVCYRAYYSEFYVQHTLKGQMLKQRENLWNHADLCLILSPISSKLRHFEQLNFLSFLSYQHVNKIDPSQRTVKMGYSVRGSTQLMLSPQDMPGKYFLFLYFF